MRSYYILIHTKHRQNVLSVCVHTVGMVAHIVLISAHVFVCCYNILYKKSRK